MDIENIEKRRIKSVQREITAKIERWASEGVAVAFDEDNKVILVRYAIPGEICRINIYKEAKDYALGEPIEIIEPSPKRIQAACQYFGRCGGCDYQMLSYAQQLQVKTEVLRETFSRIAQINLNNIEVISSPSEFNYRNTVTFKASPKNKTIGFFRKDTKSITNLESCFIAQHEINDALSTIIKSNNFPPHNFKVRATADGDLVVNMIQREEFEDREVYETVHACGYSFKFKISKDSFFQVNNSIIPLWLEKIVSFLDPQKNEKIYDLYCGLGLITLFVAHYAKETIGVEIAKSSVLDAQHNIAINTIKAPIKIIQAAVEDIVETLGYADVVIVDPPRKGLDEITRSVLLTMCPAKIIYSSCKAATMARDIKELSTKYDLQDFVLVDMFPHTHHVECIALLQREIM